MLLSGNIDTGQKEKC